MKRILATTAIALATALVATPASAATLPQGESFYGFSWFGELFEIDPTTGGSTSIFTIDDAAESSASDYNPVDGLIYVLAPYDGPCDLVVIDPNTETSTTIELTLDAGNNGRCRAMAIADDGTIYASLDDENIYTIDGATGEATLIGAVGEVSNITGMSYNSETGALYALADQDGVYAINTDTGAGNEVGLNDFDMNGFADFDSNGILWFSMWDQIYSVSDLGSFAAVEEGTIDMGLGDGNDGTESSFFAPSGLGLDSSNLADTGFGSGALAAVALLSTVAGVGLVRARLKRHTELLVETARRTLQDMRRAMTVAHQGADSVEVWPSLSTIAELFSEVESKGLVIAFNETGARFPISASAELAVYRILTESLNNTLEHAGPGTEVIISMTWSDHGLNLSVADDGERALARRAAAAGEEMPEGVTIESDQSALVSTTMGRGLSEMKARAESFDGVVMTQRVPGVGFTLTASFPMLRYATDPKTGTDSV
jgi:two-component sensor histidine kinase